MPRGAAYCKLDDPAAAVVAKQSLVQERLFRLGRNEVILIGMGVRPLGPVCFDSPGRGGYP